MAEFKPDGWGSIIIPMNALYGGFPPRPGFGRGPFGIFDHDFVHEDAGATSVTFLFHQKTGYRLAVFMAPELAAEAVELIEDVTDWDRVLKSAATQAGAIEIFERAVGDRWNHYIQFEWTFDRGLHALTRIATPEEVAQDRAAARL